MSKPLPLFPTTVIGSMPRPQYVKDLLRAGARAGEHSDEWRRHMDDAVRFIIGLQEQAGIVVARLRELGEASFRVLVEDTDDTLTVVARFLALLELYREKAVALDQETALGELLVRWTGGDGDAEPVVTDEFDRPPEPPKEETKA